MKQEVLSQFGHPYLILFGFLLFFACFLGLLLWVTQKTMNNHYQKMANLPLIDGEKNV